MKHLLKGLTTIVVATVMTSTFCLGQNSSNDLQRELERLHNQWFNAFDKGDGATMDKMEMPISFSLMLTAKAVFGKRMDLVPGGKNQLATEVP